LNVPNQPAFGREVFKHEIKALAEGYAYDDLYTMNTQSGTQWDVSNHVLKNVLGKLLTRSKGFQTLCALGYWIILQWRK
jgi:hypothetical protein